MSMVEKADDQKHFSWCCFLKPPLLPLVVTLIPSTAFFFLFFSFLSSHRLFSSVIVTTVTVLFISSSVLFHKLSKDKTRRVCLAEEAVQEENHELGVQDHASATVESQTRPCDAQGEVCEMTDLPSDTDSSSGIVENEALELLDWVSHDHMCCDVSSCDDDDDHDDDEDGLIEIALMNGAYDGLSDEEIDDVNMEEENLIEIDISIGSIKRTKC